MRERERARERAGKRREAAHKGNSLVKTGRVRVVEVTVWVGSAEDAQTQPAEVLLAGSARHLVAAVHFLRTETGGVSGGGNTRFSDVLSKGAR